MQNHSIEFFKQGFKNIDTIGTVIPCSKYVAKKIAKNIDFNNSDALVELGAGTGALTKELLRNMNPSQKIYCFEINKKFCKILNEINDPRLEVINDYAENLSKYVPQELSYIISSLPLTIFKEHQKVQILTTIKRNLKKSGRFIQFQYSTRDYKNLKIFFKNVKINFVPLNILPGFVYTCYN